MLAASHTWRFLLNSPLHKIFKRKKKIPYGLTQYDPINDMFFEASHTCRLLVVSPLHKIFKKRDSVWILRRGLGSDPSRHSPK